MAGTYSVTQKITEMPEAIESVPAATKTHSVTGQTNVIPPYTDYQKVQGKPFTVEEYDLGEMWEDTYGNEISTIDQYLRYKIDMGDIADSVTAVKNELRKLEKINNLKNEERSVIKVGVLSSYMKFLLETEGIKRNVRKYG